MAVDTNQFAWATNILNLSTIDHRVLDRPEFGQLRQLAVDVSTRFLREIMGVDHYDIFITDSWMNLTHRGSQHQRHHHKNSVISGVMFISGSVDAGGELVLYTDHRTSLDLRPNRETIWNLTEWLHKFEPGVALVFPSSVDHSVDLYTGTEPRLTLAWNTGIAGDINGVRYTQI
jgi:uncharacterized protein (TIGR02466 family)